MIRFFKQLFTANLFIKVLALILALLTYLYVHRSDIGEKKIYKVPVRITELPSDWRVIEMSASEVDLTLVGPRPKIELRNRNNIAVHLPMGRIDFSKVLEGVEDLEFEILPEYVYGRDYDIDLKYPDDRPPRINVKAARFITKKLKVQLELSGVPAAGYTVQWKQVSPTVVDVTGPEKDIRYQENISTRQVDISGEKRNIEMEAGVNVLRLTEEASPKMGLIGIDTPLYFCDSKVKVKIGINAPPKELKVAGIPVQVLKAQNKPWNIKVDPAQIDITVTGDADELNKINKSVIKAYIDADDLPATPGQGIAVGVKFFFIGEWNTLRVKDRATVKVDMTLVRGNP